MNTNCDILTIRLDLTMIVWKVLGSIFFYKHLPFVHIGIWSTSRIDEDFLGKKKRTGGVGGRRKAFTRAKCWACSSGGRVLGVESGWLGVVGGKYALLNTNSKSHWTKTLLPPMEACFLRGNAACCGGVCDVEFRCIDGSYILYQIVAVNGVPKFHEVVAKIPRYCQ